MEAFSDRALLARVEKACSAGLEYLSSLQVPGAPEGVVRISKLHDVTRWPGLCLPGSYNAIMCRVLISNRAPGYSPQARDGLITWLLSHRRPDGVFRIQGMTDDAVWKRPSPSSASSPLDETWRYIDAHVSNYTLGAIEALNEAAVPMPPTFGLTDHVALRAWLADRDMNDAWLEGNNIVNIGSFLLLRQKLEPASHAQIESCLSSLFDWHAYTVDPATGFWGNGQHSHPTRLLHAFAGSMHNYHLFYAKGRKIPHHEKAVDYCLTRPTSIDTACIDADLVDLLVHAHRLMDYRRAEIERWLRAKLVSLLHFQSPDGGFADELYGVRRFDGWVKGPEEPQGHSNTFSTWFRFIAIGMITELLWPEARQWNFRSTCGLGYRHRPAAGEDPFAHLHDENYEMAFAEKLITSASLIGLTEGRKRISLNGKFHFTRDLFDEGLRQRWYKDTNTDPKTWTVPPDHDESEGDLLQVPSCWNTVRREWLHYEGAAWYTREFKWSAAAADDRLFLRIGAANYETKVFFNGEFLGTHRGGSTPFCVELTPHLRKGATEDQRLMVQVSNMRHLVAVPMSHIDWFNYGGVYRDIDLLELPSTFVRHWFVHLVPDGTFSRIAASVALSQPISAEARLLIPELNVSATISVQHGIGKIQVDAKPELWSPERPRLYAVTIQLLGSKETLSDKIGFRQVSTSGQQILLNGKPIFLRGVCVHEDDVTLGKCSSDEDIRQRFKHAHELGCNFFRLAHYPHSERVAELADEVGLMLWSEIPVYWAIEFQNPKTYRDAENQLSEVIIRDRNRASVIMWGVGNENADTDARYHFMSRLAKAARSLDPSRLVTAACLIDRRQHRIHDRLAADLDIIGVNEYFGWYEPDMSGLSKLIANSTPDKPVIISEFGGDALAGHHGGVRELWTEECQADIYRQQLEILATAKFIAGLSPWLLYDFRTERRQNRFQRGINRKGLIAEDKKTKKASFAVLQAHYASLMKK